MNIRRILVPISGAIAITSALTAGILFCGGISDGFYYYNIHTKTRSIATTISNYKSNTGTYPDDSQIKSWSEKLALFPPLYIAAPAENKTIDDPHKIQIPTGSFALAYWDGDAFEFYYPWKDLFTTSIPKHVGTALLTSLFFSAVAFAFHKVRFTLYKRQGAAANP